MIIVGGMTKTFLMAAFVAAALALGGCGPKSALKANKALDYFDFLGFDVALESGGAGARCAFKSTVIACSTDAAVRVAIYFRDRPAPLYTLRIPSRGVHAWIPRFVREDGKNRLRLLPTTCGEARTRVQWLPPCAQFERVDDGMGEVAPVREWEPVDIVLPELLPPPPPTVEK